MKLASVVLFLLFVCGGAFAQETSETPQAAPSTPEATQPAPTAPEAAKPEAAHHLKPLRLKPLNLKLPPLSLCHRHLRALRR